MAGKRGTKKKPELPPSKWRSKLESQLTGVPEIHLGKTEMWIHLERAGFSIVVKLPLGVLSDLQLEVHRREQATERQSPKGWSSLEVTYGLPQESIEISVRGPQPAQLSLARIPGVEKVQIRKGPPNGTIVMTINDGYIRRGQCRLLNQEFSNMGAPILLETLEHKS